MNTKNALDTQTENPTETKGGRPSLLSPAMIFLAGCLWGTMGLFVRHLNGVGFSSLQISFMRSFIAFLIFLVMALCKNPRLLRIRLRDVWCFLGTGLASLTFFNYCYFKTITLTSLSVAAILLYTEPAIVMVLSAPLFHEKFTPRKLIALGMTLVGCVFVTGILTDAPSLSPLGILTGLGAGLGYSLYSIFGRYALQKGYNSLTINVYTFFFSALSLTFLCDLPDLGRVIAAGEMPWLWAILLALIATALPYFFYTMGLSKVENGKAAIIASVEPIMATVLGILVFHENMDLWIALGILFVMGAIVLLNLPQKKHPEA